MLKLKTDAEMIETGHHQLYLHAKALQEEVMRLRSELEKTEESLHKAHIWLTEETAKTKQ